MQASATTENITIQPEIPKGTEPSAKLKHIAPQHFGRYAEGCPACAAKYPDGPPAKTARTARVPKAARASAPVSSGMTNEQVMLMIQELRKPDEDTLRKRAEERAAEARRSQEMLELARTEVEQVTLRQSNCHNVGGPHSKENGRSAIQGQVHSDGLYHGICVRCGYKATPVRPPEGALVGGLQ